MADADPTLTQLFQANRQGLAGAVRSVLGPSADVTELLQEAFLKCWKHQDQVAGVQNLKAWIFRIALNTGRDLRETAWRRKRQGLPEDDTGLAGNEQRPDEIVEHDERLQRLRGAMQQLRDEEKEVFLLRQNGDMTYEEIAEALEIPSGTVKTRMRLALSRLRTVLGEG